MRRSICAFSLLSISFTLISDRPIDWVASNAWLPRERWRWERACGHEVSRLVIVLEAMPTARHSHLLSSMHVSLIISLSVDINLEKFCRFAPSSSNHVGKIYPFLERYYFFILFYFVDDVFLTFYFLTSVVRLIIASLGSFGLDVTCCDGSLFMDQKRLGLIID